MVKNRLIATLLVYRGNVVQTRCFKRTNMVGSAFTAVDFFNGWMIDEIIVLEISEDGSFLERFHQLVEELSRRCFVPLSIGGKISDKSDAARFVRSGADKIIVNTHGISKPHLIEDISRELGTQCCVVSIDAKPDPEMPSEYTVMGNNGREDARLDVVEWAQKVVGLGAGEIMINSVEMDGDKRGYDLPLVKLISDSVSVPVIAMGGVGKWQDFVDGILIGGADAVAAGNIFHYSEHSTKKAKEFMVEAGLNVRRPDYYKIDIPRLPKYKPYI